jgi:hypothetical protein
MPFRERVRQMSTKSIIVGTIWTIMLCVAMLAMGWGY